ncbi:MAG TPA: AsmA family protein [Steroidobacteraceae bacterium]|nr:AsmA family protein [Steroidobacteraceae bacterium]
MRILKWISYGIGALVVLLLLALLVLVWVVDPNRFKPRIEAEVRKATGREFTLVGDIELGFFPWLALRSGPGQFGNPPGFPAEPMASWRRAQVGAKLLPLLRGELVVDRVRLSGLDLRLVRHADGSANWQGIGSGEPAEAEPADRQLTVDGVELADSRLLFVDEGAPRRIEITGLSLTTDEISAGRPFTDTRIAGRLHMKGFASEGVPFELEVPRVTLAEDASRLGVPEFSAKFGGLEVAGGVEGSLAEPLRIEGKLTSEPFDARALLGTMGIEAPGTTDPRALTRLQLAADWQLDGGAISIDPLKLTLDDTHFSGSFRRGAGENPVGEFRLHGDALDLARYIPPANSDSEPFVLPTARLRALQFRGVLELEQATLGDVVMKGVTLRLLLDGQGLRSVENSP